MIFFTNNHDIIDKDTCFLSNSSGLNHDWSLKYEIDYVKK